MAMLFWFALVLGGGLLLVSTVGHIVGDVLGDTGGGDVSDGAQADADSDTAGGVHPVAPGAHGADHEGFRFLSVRTVTYFLFAFGAAGVLLTYAWHGMLPLVAGGVALACGILTAYLSAMIFNWVGAGDSGALAGDRALVGASGVVTLPLRADGTGKVLVRSSGRELELLARAIDAAPGNPAEWTDVMVVDVADGVALVTPFDSSGA